MNRIVQWLLFFAGISVQGQELFFNASFEHQGEKICFPVYWRDCQAETECRQADCFPFETDVSSSLLLAEYELNEDVNHWTPEALFLISRCYWARNQYFESHIVADVLTVLEPTNVQYASWSAHCLAVFRKGGWRHAEILRLLKSTQHGDEFANSTWNIFWECCRVNDVENGRKAAIQLLEMVDKLKTEERLLLGLFILQIGDNEAYSSFSMQLEQSLSPESNSQLIPSENHVVVFLSASQDADETPTETWEKSKNLVQRLSNARCNIKLKTIERGSTLPEQPRIGVEAGLAETGDSVQFENVISLNLPISLDDQGSLKRIVGRHRFAQVPFVCRPVQNALINSFEMAPMDMDSEGMQLVLLNYLSMGEYQKANQMFPSVIETVTNEELEYFRLLQVESLLMVPDEISKGLNLAVDCKDKFGNSRFRYLALWAALSIADYSTSKLLIDEFFENNSSDPWFESSLGAFLMFSINCPNNRESREVFEKTAAFCLNSADNTYPSDLFKSKLGMTAIQHNMPDGLKPEVRDDKECFASTVSVRFVERQRLAGVSGLY